MSVQVVRELCYLEEAGSDRDIPPGYQAMDVASTPKPGRLAGWLGGQRVAKRIVYKERCRLHWNDLELVSFLPGGGMLGYWCRCELFVQVTEPDQLLDELGTEEPDGRWTVSLDALAAWFREPIAEALETLGANGDLCSEAYWPTVAEQVPGRLRYPRGVMLDQPEEQQTNAFILHKILTFEQYLKALELYTWFLERLRQLGYDRQLVRVQLAAERGGDEVAENVLNELGEDNLATLITPEERKQAATKRLSSYIELAGSAADSELRPGVTLGRYELLTPLGQGGQGQVWKAWDTTAELFVVLKLVPRELHNATEEMNRLRSTFHIIQRLHHSNICPVLLLDRDPRFGWYQVMQYIDGQTLSTYRATYTARYGSFPLDQVVKVLRPVAEALDYAHRQNVIHRDIKPANIMVSGEAEDVQLVDFGLAAAIRTSLSTVSGQRMDTSGARPYMAPEQWRGEHQDQATDQYGLAVVAYELLLGQPPFDSDDFDILSDCVQNRVPPAIGDQPEAVNRVLVRGLAKKRRERYPNCVAFIDATGYDAGEHWKKPGYTQDETHPVVQIGWNDAVAFAKWLSEKEGEEYRLLTEAEWEYSCRAGTTTRYYFGDSADALGDYAWYSGNAGGKTHPVGQKKPNAWGLYDMHGLVWEWCSDWYGRYEGVGVADDPTGPEGGSYRVYRGGCWYNVASRCRASSRFRYDPGYRYDFLGFRLSRTVSSPSR